MIDPTVAHSPRVWNYWLGGKDNYEVDRRAGDQFARLYPSIVTVARYSRAFVGRALTHLAGPAGVHQFLDIGSGLPAADNTHEVVRRVTRDARVVYVDNDPMVSAYSRALLADSTDGATAVVEADLHDPEVILAAAAATLDLRRPVGLVLANVLGHIAGIDTAMAVVRQLLDALAAGSHLVIADGTNVVDGPAIEDAIRFWNEIGSPPYHLRTPAEIGRFFEGMTLLDPGVVSCPHWRPQIVVPDAVDEFCAVGRKD